MNAYKKIIAICVILNVCQLLFHMRVTSRRTKFSFATFISGVNVTPPHQSKFCCFGISSSHFGIATLLQLIQLSLKCIRSKFNSIVGDPPDENLPEELMTRVCPGQHGMLTATWQLEEVYTTNARRTSTHYDHIINEHKWRCVWILHLQNFGLSNTPNNRENMNKIFKNKTTNWQLRTFPAFQ